MFILNISDVQIENVFCQRACWRKHSPPSFDVLVINILMGPGCATGVCRSQGGEYWKELEYCCNLPKQYYNIATSLKIIN